MCKTVSWKLEPVYLHIKCAKYIVSDVLDGLLCCVYLHKFANYTVSDEKTVFRKLDPVYHHKCAKYSVSDV